MILNFSIIFIVIFTSCMPSGSITGHIYNMDGTILSSKVLVCCLAKSPNVNITHGDPAPPYLVMQAEGSYKIDKLPSGDYALWVIDRSANLFSNGISLIHVPASQEADFKLVPGGSISGHVLDENRQPISTKVYLGSLYKVRVTCENETMGSTADVSEDGTYYFGNLMPGKYRIRASIGINSLYENVEVESNRATIYDFSYNSNSLP